MAMGLANLLRPEPFKCKKKGDSEQLLQDFKQYRAKMELFFTAAQAVEAHTGDPADRSAAEHTVCTSCRQEKAMTVMLGGEEMNKLFEHVGDVTDEDSYVGAMNKVELGIKGLTNQATARFKLFQEMPQDGRGFREWSQLVVEQANRCDWTGYDKSKAARDAILFQMEDKKLRRKIIAEDPALPDVIKLGIANEQAAKVADRFKPKQEHEKPKERIAALEEQVRALSKATPTGGGKKKTSCTTCTRPTHGEGKCRALTATCHACHKVGHFKGSKACSKTGGKGKATVNAVESDSEQGDTDSEAESVNRVTEEQVRASRTDAINEDLAKVEMTMIDHGRQAPARNVKLLVDSGVRKTLINEDIWRKMQKKAGGQNLKLKKCKTKFRPYGTKQHLPIIGRSKCRMQAEAGATIHSMVYVMRGQEQPLLGLIDAQRLGIIQMNMKGAAQKEDVVARLEKVEKEQTVKSGPVSGGQSQEEIDREMRSITDKFPNLFSGLGRAKVEPVHIEVDKKVKPIQQKRRTIALHYVDRLKKHMTELKEEGVISGPLGPEWARGWICNPVITGKKWDTKKIRVNLDTRTMKEAVKTSKFPIPTVAELRHEFRGSDRFSVLDMNHAFHQFAMTEESKKLFVFYTPWGLYCYNTLVMGTAPASSECHERIRIILEGLEGVTQIKDDLVVHGKGQAHDKRLEKVLKRLMEYGLTLRKEKCQFGVEEVTWFGMIFSKQGMSPDPEKVQIIRDWPVPEDKAAVKSFLQTCQFSQEFMRPGSKRTYSDVTLPLRRLTAMHVRFNWTAECQRSFQELKELLLTSTVAVHWDPARKTRIYVDHGPAGVGGTIAQDHGRPGGQPSWRPVHYSSRALTKAEANYGKVDGESLGVASMIMANKMYLYGTEFEAVTDHQPLCSLYNCTNRNLPARVARHLSKLGGFNFKLVYEPGSTTPSDYASRHPARARTYTKDQKEELGVEEEDEEAEFIVNRIQGEMADAITWEEVEHSTTQDNILQALKEDIKKGTLRKEDRMAKYKECFTELSCAAKVVMRGEKLVLPKALVPDVLEAAHEGHPGMESMLRQLRQMYWWPGMTEDIREYVATCNIGCAAATPKNSPPPMVVRETPEEVWQHLAADFKGPIVGQGKSYYFHVVIDLFSRWPEVAVVTSTAFDKLQPSLERIWALHGKPDSITHDNGPPYDSREWRRYARQVGFDRKPCSPEHPEGNGIAERFMGVIVKLVHASIAEKKDPKLEIERRLMQYRNTPHPSTGKTPSELMFNRVVRTRLPTVRKVVNTVAVQEAREKDQQERLKRKEMRDRKKTAQERAVKPGDKVLVAQRKTTTKPPFDPNPYTITEVKGTQVTVEREGKKSRKRNMAKVKMLQERPERLRSTRKRGMETEEEPAEWWELPNIRPVPAGDQGEQGGPQHQPEDQQHPQAEEAAQQHPQAGEAGPPQVARGMPVKERWEVALGPWRPKLNSPSPRDRKRRQQAARKRDKERRQHPYQLRSKEGQEEEELSD